MRDLRDFDILILPGWHNSEPGHWQSEWQATFPNVTRVEQDDWETPVYSDWAATLAEAVAAADKPILFITHSLGTALVMRWAQQGDTKRIAGAFFVAASDRDRFDNQPDSPIRGFAPMLTDPLPFPSMLLASRNDPRVTFERAKFFADAWGSTFVDAGELGHMDTELGIWPQGLVWLGQFIGTLPKHSN
ncbi:RBBP9/YdeN family alpha/beta hydrolase [Mesorhizobium sp. LjNodule214]|uniref:RBBP9/YdeN family alpha/beta hydrolase n=1 Tax=Mesorhizobium sp. LjNodule214 TaxID=3342252 RepID=UPI003ECFF537